MLPILDQIVNSVELPVAVEEIRLMRSEIEQLCTELEERNEQQQANAALTFIWAIIDLQYADLAYFALHVAYYSGLADRTTLEAQQEFLAKMLGS
jgi:hypothetical protein